MTDTDNALKQAKAQLRSIREMVAELSDPDSDRREDAQDAIFEDPLEVSVRSGWGQIGDPMSPEEFRILLCTGGPAVQIIGALNEHSEPHDVRLQYQDWFTPWIDLPLEDDELDDVMTYCQQFCFETQQTQHKP